MDFLRLPFFKEIEKANVILLAGAGGGFDIFTGLPLYFGLRSAGKQVHLANLSFAPIYASDGRRIGPSVVEVTGETLCPTRYFPELYLARWFRFKRKEEVPTYCFDRTGVQPLLAGYRALVEMLNVDTVILVDGGTDSLMRGDESGLGTPEEDIASIAAVDDLDVATKLLVCLGFGIDAFHGVCHADFLEAVAEITRSDGFLGAWSVTKEMPEFDLYREASAYVFHLMSHHPSIVNTSIISAVEGRFGNHHTTYRTEGSELFLNALMTLYWGFRLKPVAERILYLEEMKQTQTYENVQSVVLKARAKFQPYKPWRPLPM